MEFYIISNSERQGPFSLENLSKKGISSNTMVWSIGYTTWKKAKDVPELSELLSNLPPDLLEAKPMPKSWMAESILATLFCCLPFGIVGIIQASKVSSLYAQGNYNAAQQASLDAGKWTKIAFFVGLTSMVIYILIYVIAIIVVALNTR